MNPINEALQLHVPYLLFGSEFLVSQKIMCLLYVTGEAVSRGISAQICPNKEKDEYILY